MYHIGYVISCNENFLQILKRRMQYHYKTIKCVTMLFMTLIINCKIESVTCNFDEKLNSLKIITRAD